MFKGRVLFSLNLHEILDQGVLRHRKRLGYDDVIAIREKGKGVLDKLERTRLVCLVDAEQVDDDRIIGFIGNV